MQTVEQLQGNGTQKVLESKNLCPDAHLDHHLDINMNTDLSLQERSHSRFNK